MKRRRTVPCRILVAGLIPLFVTGVFAQSKFLPQFGVVSITYRDLDGDQDSFPDPGETGRLVVTLRNGQNAYTNASLELTTFVACILDAVVPVGTLAPGQTVEVGSLDPSLPGFRFATTALASASAADPVRLDFCVRLRADQIAGVSPPVCFSLQADLSPPATAAPFIAGPDGANGTADDGTLLENFDVDRDGDSQFTVRDTFRMTDAGTGLVGRGEYMRAVEPPGGSAMSAVRCGGYSLFGEGHCMLDPDHPMDWHLHCPPGATNCSNIDSGPCLDGLPGAPCTFATPADGQKAASPPNSLHMGLHFSGRDSTWDTTHFRTIQAYRSGPINLTPLPRPGDLIFSMLHIADLMDEVSVGNPPSLPHPCVDCGDVQIQIDRAADPAVDDWGIWEKLAPFQNIYDHVPAAWSYYGAGDYCVQTPTDAGRTAPSPYGFHETLCFPQGAWSSCGAVRGTTLAGGRECDGPGIADPSGSGLWVQTRFDLSSFLGQRIRLRWIAESWVFDEANPHYAAVGGSWGNNLDDDGWWLDDIRITGVVTSQSTPVVDQHPAVVGPCTLVCPDRDGDGYGFPGSAACPFGPSDDCDDLRMEIHPGAPEGCNGVDNDCDGAPTPEELDVDGDGLRTCEGDCDDNNATVRPGAAERADGIDNSCPGEPGYGLVDELSSHVTFLSGGVRLQWGPVVGASQFQAVRSTRVDFSGNCTVFNANIFNRYIDDPAIPAPNQAFFYLVRNSVPYIGDWWRNSAGMKRVLPCLP